MKVYFHSGFDYSTTFFNNMYPSDHYTWNGMDWFFDKTFFCITACNMENTQFSCLDHVPCVSDCALIL